MERRIIALIAISSIISLGSTIHGHSYGSLITEENGLNVNQVYPIVSLINNQTSDKEIMIKLKSQLDNSDPFKSQINNNEGNNLNWSSTQDFIPNDVNSNEDGECKSNCADELKPIRDDVPFELPSIPFP